ncbi:P2Y purinoceptor 14 [Larimichthys crocea]|uniref:P2Y purinoceptor 14 n=1 Tax=Larimichthys crocea TaxID=215358 RepID=A0A6G0IU95_LARCR|nr:P2Y purinoceptor 14 [Larimichthys crocea]
MEPLNSTNQSYYSSILTHQVLPPLYFMIFVVGMCLNGVAAWIFFRVPSDSGLVVYLKNMVVADLLMLSTFPFRSAAQLGLGGWHLHVITCRYTAVLFYSSIVGFARVLAVLTWSLLLLCVFPNVLLTSRPAHEGNARHCMKLKTPLGVQWHRVSTFFSVSLFWVTLLILAFCYTSIACRVYQSYRRVRQNNSDARRKSNRSIFSILAVFFICFVPYHVCRVPYTLSQMPASDFSEHTRFLLFQLKEGTLFLSALNVCLDPIIYFLMCRIFRESLLRKLSGRGARRSLTTAQSLSNI